MQYELSGQHTCTHPIPWLLFSAQDKLCKSTLFYQNPQRSLPVNSTRTAAPDDKGKISKGHYLGPPADGGSGHEACFFSFTSARRCHCRIRCASTASSAGQNGRFLWRFLSIFLSQPYVLKGLSRDLLWTFWQICLHFIEFTIGFEMASRETLEKHIKGGSAPLSSSYRLVYPDWEPWTSSNIYFMHLVGYYIVVGVQAHVNPPTQICRSQAVNTDSPQTAEWYLMRRWTRWSMEISTRAQRAWRRAMADGRRITENGLATQGVYPQTHDNYTKTVSSK